LRALRHGPPHVLSPFFFSSSFLLFGVRLPIFWCSVPRWMMFPPTDRDATSPLRMFSVLHPNSACASPCNPPTTLDRFRSLFVFTKRATAAVPLPLTPLLSVLMPLYFTRNKVNEPVLLSFSPLSTSSDIFVYAYR